jgi:hypothetical protein
MASIGFVAKLSPPFAANWRMKIESLGFALEHGSALVGAGSQPPNHLFGGVLVDEDGRYPCDIARVAVE